MSNVGGQRLSPTSVGRFEDGDGLNARSGEIGAYLANGKLGAAPQPAGREKTLKTKEIYEWSQMGHEVLLGSDWRQSICWGKEKKKKKKRSCKTFSPNQNVSTQFAGVKLMKGDCSRWHYKMLIPIKDDIQKAFCLFNSNESGAHCGR